MIEDYSQKEIEMFKALGFGHLLDTSIDAWGMYRIAVDKMFIENSQSPYTDCLRRGYKAIQNCNPYRMTPEFDFLVTLDSG